MKKKLLFAGMVVILGITSACGNGKDNDGVEVKTEQVAEQTTEKITEEITEADSSTTDNEDYYSVCTNLSKSEVEAFAKEVKDQILKKDWTGLAEKVSYPITIAGVTYNGSGEFSNADLDAAFDTDFMTAIEEESCTDMFCNYQGIMLGNGQVWISEVLNDDMTSQGLKILEINCGEN
jgi:hypothetical protein